MRLDFVAALTELTYRTSEKFADVALQHFLGDTFLGPNLGRIYGLKQ